MAKSDGKITIDVDIDSKKSRKQLDDVEDGLKDVSKTAKKAESSAKGMASTLQKAFKAAAAGIAALGIKSAVGAVMDFVDANREMVSDLARLDTNARQAGIGVESARDEVAKLQAITGEADSSVEALSNVMAAGFKGEQLSQVMEEISGAAIKFSDTLKAEGIADGLQETLATGEAIGPFAELLERSGVDIEFFNAGLAGATTEADKMNYVLQELSKLGLTDTLEGYKEANGAAYEFEMANARAEQAAANLAEKLMPLQTNFINLKTKMFDGISALLSFEGGLQGLVSMIAAKAPELTQNMIQWLMDAMARYTEMYPELMQKGVEILTSIIQGIAENLPMIIETVLSLLTTMYATILENLPTMLEAGIQVLEALIDGIMEIIPKLPDIIFNVITTLVDALIANLPTILSTGIKLLITLTNGILQALPQLAAAAIKLIVMLVSYIVQNLPQILAAGVKILGELAKGLLSALGQLWDVTKQIGTGIVEKLTGIDLVSVGKNLLEGLKNGMMAGVNKVLDTAKSIGSKVKDVFTGLFDIHSPSRWARDHIAGNIMKGLNVGVKRYGPGAIRAFMGYVDNIKGDINGIVQNKPNAPSRTFTSTINYNGASSSLAELEMLQRRQMFILGA